MAALRLLVVATIATVVVAAPVRGETDAIGTRGSWLALVQGGDESRIVLMRPDGSRRRTLVPAEFGAQSPAWRPDGRAVAFVSSRRGNPGIFLADVDSGRVERLVARGTTGRGDPAFSRDGRSIAYTRSYRGSDILVARADGSSPRVLFRDGRENSEPTWSPDGTRIAFIRNTRVAVVSVRSRRARLLSPGDEWARSSAWDGRSIAFVRTPTNSDRGRLAVMRPDGSGLRNLAPPPGCRRSRVVPRQPLARFHAPRVTRLGALPPPAVGRRRAQGDAEQHFRLRRRMGAVALGDWPRTRLDGDEAGGTP